MVTLLVEIVDDLIASGQTASPEFTDVSTHMSVRLTFTYIGVTCYFKAHVIYM